MPVYEFVCEDCGNMQGCNGNCGALRRVEASVMPWGDNLRAHSGPLTASLAASERAARNDAAPHRNETAQSGIRQHEAPQTASQVTAQRLLSRRSATA